MLKLVGRPLASTVAVAFAPYVVTVPNPANAIPTMGELLTPIPPGTGAGSGGRPAWAKAATPLTIPAGARKL